MIDPISVIAGATAAYNGIKKACEMGKEISSFTGAISEGERKFLIEQIGPDVMTFTHVEIDPKIGESIPQLLQIYKKWLVPIQQHHAAFTAMEGMAAFAIENILKEDKDFQNYLTTFMGTDFSAYQVRKSMGKDFTKTVYEKLGTNTFKKMIEIPPNTKELKDPQLYLKKLS